MADPKKPQDHQSKKAKPKVEKVDGGWEVTHKGATITLASEVFDDFELLDEIASVEEGKGNRLPALLRRLVGADQFRTVMEALRDKKTGRVSVEAGAEFLGEIFEAVDPNS